MIKNLYKIISVNRDSLLILIFKISYTALSIIISILLANLLGLSNYGQYTYVITIVAILSIPVELGFPNLIIRYIAKYEFEREWGFIRGLLKVSNLTILVITGALLIGLIIFNELNPQYDDKVLMSLGYLIIPFIALSAVRDAALRGFRYVVLSLVSENIIRPVVFIVSIIVIGEFIYGELTSEIAIILYLLSIIVSFFFGTFLLYRKIPTEVIESKPYYKFKEWITVAVPLFINSGMYIVHNKIDIVVLGMIGTSNDVGVYDIIWKGAVLSSLGNNAFNTYVAPYYSRYFSEGKIYKMQSLSNQTVKLNFVISLFVTIILVVFGKQVLLSIYSITDVKAYYALMILLATNLINVIFGSSGVLLNMTGHEVKVLYSLLISVAVNIIMNIIFIPKYGYLGASISSLFTIVVWKYVLLKWSIRYVGVNTALIKIL